MKIETLPLLSSDFATWTWAESNGVAQDSSTRISYFALVNKDLCNRFVGEVWNDLVRKLNSALTYAGIKWDSTYGEVSDVLLDTSIRANREFKAFMFNAVVLNINQFGFIHWNWERTNEMPGFLGRTYMRGYSEYGTNSDFIYGWYILELAEKLNVLIKVLKNEGPFREYEGLIPVAVYTPTEVYLAQSGIFFHLDKSEIIINASLGSACGIGTKSQEKSLSYVTGKLIDGFPKKINSYIGAYTDAGAKVTLAKRQDIPGDVFSETFFESELTGMVFVQKLLYAYEMQTKYTTGFSVPFSLKLKFEKNISSRESAQIICVPRISWMETVEKGISYAIDDLLLRESVILSTTDKADSFSISEIILRDKILIDSILRSKSYVESSLNYKRAQYMRRLIKSSSYQSSNIDAKVSMAMEKSKAVWSYYEATAVARAIETFEKILQSDTGYIGNLAPVLANPIDFSGEKEKTYVNGSMKAIQGEFVSAKVKPNSYTDSEIMEGIPKLLEEIMHVKEYDISELQTVPCEVVEFEGDSITLHNAKIVTKLSEGLENKCKSSTAAVCMLEFESTKETWYDPVQSGTDLYIRNAYPQWKEGTNVHLDSGGVFYEK